MEIKNANFKDCSNLKNGYIVKGILHNYGSDDCSDDIGKFEFRYEDEDEFRTTLIAMEMVNNNTRDFNEDMDVLDEILSEDGFELNKDIIKPEYIETVKYLIQHHHFWMDNITCIQVVNGIGIIIEYYWTLDELVLISDAYKYLVKIVDNYMDGSESNNSDDGDGYDESENDSELSRCDVWEEDED